MTKMAVKKQKTKDVFTVLNDRGIHTRPSTEIVKCAASFKSDIYLIYRKSQVNAKSILGILMLAAPKGARIRIEAEGVDAEEAVKSLKRLAEAQFNIKY